MIPAWFDNVFMRVDFVSWIDLAIGFFRHGRLHRFEWMDQPAMEIYSNLRKFRIHPYGPGMYVHEFVDDAGQKRRRYRRWCYINRRQAEFAEYLLLATCVPLISPLLNPNNRRAWGKGLPRRQWESGQARAAGPVEVIVDWLAALWG